MKCTTLNYLSITSFQQHFNDVLNC